MITDSVYMLLHNDLIPLLEEVGHAHKAPGTKGQVMHPVPNSKLPVHNTPTPTKPKINYYLVGAALLLADYVGDIIYHVVPLLGGVPTLVGMVYLCRLVVDMQELQRVMREYVGGGDDG